MELICSLIEDCFGSVPEAIDKTCDSLPAEDLRHLAVKVGKIASLADLGLPGGRGGMGRL